ncbi:MAG: serine hydrolase domain-containing protein [Acidobacteriaceae bacterium]
MKFSPLMLPARALQRVATGICLAASLVVCGSALAAPHDDQALEEALHKDLQDYLTTRSSIEHISTLSMSITFRGSKEGIIDAVGTTQYGGGKPVTPENLFQIGSNTKVFTAAVLLRLEAEGVLCLDDTLGKWLPQYPAWSKVTIHELLNMTSGIPTYDLTPAWNTDYEDNPYRKSTLEDLVAYVYPTIKTPGARFEYSNTGYILVQMIIDKASGSHSYKAELDRLIEEVRLHDTFYEAYFYPSFVNRRLVSGYYVNTDDDGLSKLLGTDTKNYSLGWTQAAGGLISNPRDLTRWIRELFEGDVLPPQQKKELESLVSIPDAIKIPETSEQYPQGFGLGVFQITAPPLGLFWFYQGSTIGYRAAYAYLPDSGVIICVFTNSQAAAKVSEVDKVLVETLFETLKKFGKI